MFKKRKSNLPAYQSTETGKLRAISRLVGKGNVPAALQSIDTELQKASSLKPAFKGKLLGQAALTMYRRGKFRDASHAFKRAAEASASHPVAWFKPTLSQVRALLKEVSVNEAQIAADACYAVAEKKIQEFSQARVTAATQLAQTGKAVIPLKPLRLSVVASSLGEVFLSEGEIDAAKIFFEKAITSNPRGGTRARQGLAEIALRNDKPDEAFQRSIEAITLGKFQAKTVSTWKLFFAAKRKLGQSGIPQELLASIKTCVPSVKARTILAVTKEMRSGSDPQWKIIANDWLATDAEKFPPVAAELRKLLVADSKSVSKDPAQRVTTAKALLATKNLAPNEWLSGAKENVRASLFANQSPDIEKLLLKAATLYGNGFIPQVKHSLALSCMLAKRHDLARSLLKSAIEDTSSTQNHIWSKAQWALGRMEAFLERYPAAIKAYNAVASSAKVPKRFQLQARILWAETMLKTGSSDGLEDVASKLPEMLKDVSDFELLLNFARQLRKLGGEMKASAEKIFKMGEKLAISAYESAEHPSLAIDILFKFTRRQLYDFGGYKAVIARWESMPDGKLMWMWTNNRQYWMYFAMVAEAYLRDKNPRGAASAVGVVVNDSATPREALAIVGAPYYEAILKTGSYQKAIDGFRWLTTEYPTVRGTALAYYWLALAAYKGRKADTLVNLVNSLKVSNAHTEITYDRWKFGAKSELLLCNLEVKKVSSQEVNYSEDFLTKMRSEVVNDLDWIKE